MIQNTSTEITEVSYDVDATIHFIIVAIGVGKDEIAIDSHFEITEHLPTHTLTNIYQFCPFKLPDALTFYLNCKRLTN